MLLIPTSIQEPSAHTPRLALTALACYVLTSLLLFSGGFTTSIGAGMIFADWPLSNGSVNPEGWTENPAMLAEHGHRLTGMAIGLLTLTLTLAILYFEKRHWVKNWALLSLALVVIQGIMGGLRVMMVSTSFAVVHGCLAQIFLCSLATILSAYTLFRQKSGIPDSQTGNGSLPSKKSLLVTGGVLVGLTLMQLLIAAVMRHSGAGLAISTFPFTRDGILPEVWTFPIAIHYAHRIMAVIILFAWVRWFYLVRSYNQESLFFLVAKFSGGILGFQIALGIMTVLSGRHPWIATLHVIAGAYFLSLVWLQFHYIYSLGKVSLPRACTNPSHPLTSSSSQTV